MMREAVHAVSALGESYQKNAPDLKDCKKFAFVENARWRSSFLFVSIIIIRTYHTN